MGSYKSPSKRREDSRDYDRRSRRDDSHDYERRSRKDDSHDYERRSRKDDSHDYERRSRKDDSHDYERRSRKDDSHDYERRKRRDRSPERRRRRDDSYDDDRTKDRSFDRTQNESTTTTTTNQTPTMINASSTSTVINESASNTVTSQGTTQVKKRRASRFAPETERFSIPGIPVAIAGEMDDHQRKLYLIQLRIEEIGLKLRTGNLGLNDFNTERSPSPEPIYNSMGIRQNTRELRVRQKLEDERHKLINEAKLLNPDYKPPLDYRPTSNKIIDKVMIPQDVHPSINFIGLLIGPRGNTLKRLESESNTKIIIRGKGSLKEGKLRTQPLPGEDEPLHALVTANNSEDLRKGMALIQSIIDDGLSNPDGDNELRRLQLRELAQLNGTLIASEVSRCKNCGSSDHRHWECPQAKNITNITICEKCGGGGHIASDCIYDGERAQTAEEKSKLDSAYNELMNELGVKNEGLDGFYGGESSSRNIPSILALPKVVVSQLPWANAAGGFLGGNSSGPQLSLPSTIPPNVGFPYGGFPGMMGFQPMPYQQMNPYAPAPFAEAFGLPQQASYPQIPTLWPNMPNATTNNGIPVSQIINITTNEGVPISELHNNSNNSQPPEK